MKKVLLVICLALVPVSFMGALWQSYSYQLLEDDVARLETRRKELVEEGFRLTVALDGETAPAVIEGRAKAELGMTRPGRDQLVHLRPEGGQ